MKKLIATLVSVLALTLLAGCGGDAAASAAGTYQIDKAAFEASMKAEMKDQPTEGPAADMAKQAMEQMMASLSGSIELKQDGTCTMKMSMGGPETVETGTWKLDGDKLSVTTTKDGKEETNVAKFADGVITIEEEQGGKTVQMKFKKAGK
ncbi:MAG: hypothetical protein KAI24_15165 [Planctomycetes bacterium]|nr:hypothetical protein [Planctomycetota bacterium]